MYLDCRWGRNWQLTDTNRAVKSVSVVTDTLITTRCVLTPGVFRTPAVIFRTLVYVCTVKLQINKIIIAGIR